MNETGMVIAQNEFSLVTIFGEPARVEFPDALIWDYHMRRAGQILTLAHTHPTGFYELSEEDRTTLKAWTMALSPCKISMDVICKVPSEIPENSAESGIIYSADSVGLSHRRYFYVMESLQEWISRGKEGVRKMSLEYKIFNLSEYHPDWLAKIIEFSNL